MLFRAMLNYDCLAMKTTLNLNVVITQAVSRQPFTAEAWVLCPHQIGV